MKEAGVRLLMVLGWTAVLPLVGYSIFGVLTIVPLLGLFLGPSIILVVYTAGAVPALLTAAAFEFGLRHWGFARSLVPSIALGAAASALWMEALLRFEGPSARGWVGFNYLTFALCVAGAFPAALMPVTRFAKDSRRWR